MIEENQITHWQIDKRIPIALLVTLFLQIATALIWATQLNARVVSLEGQANHSADFGEKLARIDERLGHIKQDMEHIKHVIENNVRKITK